jgi:hypothetical protein
VKEYLNVKVGRHGSVDDRISILFFSHELVKSGFEYQRLTATLATKIVKKLKDRQPDGGTDCDMVWFHAHLLTIFTTLLCINICGPVGITWCR